MAPLKQRAQAAAYDWFVLTALGTVVMTGVAWISGRDLFEDGGALAAAILALLVLDALYEVPATAITGQTIVERHPG